MPNTLLLSDEIFQELTSSLYSDKALLLFMHIGFRAGAGHKLYTNITMLCDLTNQRSRETLICDLRQMENFCYITTTTPNDKGFFWINLEYDAFMPQADFVEIHFDEFELIQQDRYLIKILYGIKRYRHQDTKISFSSYDTISKAGNVSKSTISKHIKDLASVMQIKTYTIVLQDGGKSQRNFYKSKSDGELTFEEVADIVADYYPNSTILHS